ncbi:quinol:electron acceptor oxidoreductase subunit ActD [Rhodopirellula sp. SWK7]|uniref:quinol:electron acceptor oxidoreductase subunit ActD n=1 Tax=Rhodopirellula sp. SWK7 TaxID=595460 RepID=UPI0002BE6DAF|nr:quinol:electron acceptor oxidoreductase subunit ActD [Rhodopirellula sp. SWK7]EMI44126.1 putative membrane protein [Rhodopirellula sp. SWK7]
MSETKPAPKTVADGNTVHGVVAEFSDVDSLLAACERVRDAGYTKADAFTPFPVHGIDKALGIKPTVLPWIALTAGAIGTCTALTMQIWMNGIDYQYIISGKPYISLPAFIPVSFELTILFASFGTFFGMWALNGLPRFSNPMFTSPRFDRATDDTFFLYLDAKDERFNEEGAKALLGDLGGAYIEPVVEDDSPKKIPSFLLIAIAVVIAFSMIPALVVARMRVTKSSSPRFHIFPDMDFSPAKDAQQISTLFADGRAMRPDVPGTVSRGGLDWDVDFQTGIDMEKLAQVDAPRARQLVAMMQSDTEVVEADGEVAGEEEAVKEVVEETTEEVQADEPSTDEPSADEPASEEPAAEEPEAEMTEEAEAPAEEEPAAEETESTEETPAEEEPAEEEPAEEEMTAEETPAEEPAAEEPVAEAKTEEPEAEASKPEAPTALAPASGPTVDTTPWLTDNPLAIDAAVLERGQQQFNIYCSVCHGMNGRGNGLVNQRAQRILATTWTPPSNLHDATLYQDVYPDGKLFGTISNGVRKMPGYAAQIRAKDRWAIVSYVRALQASQNASLDEVPASQREAIEKKQSEVKAELEKAAAEEAAKAKKSAT